LETHFHTSSVFNEIHPIEAIKGKYKMLNSYSISEPYLYSMDRQAIIDGYYSKKAQELHDAVFKDLLDSEPWDFSLLRDCGVCQMSIQSI
jgi:hypothetical protein